jgi:hypothetical protein
MTMGRPQSLGGPSSCVRLLKADGRDSMRLPPESPLPLFVREGGQCVVVAAISIAGRGACPPHRSPCPPLRLPPTREASARPHSAWRSHARRCWRRGVVPHPDNTAESGLLAVTTGVRPTRYSWRSTGVAFIRYDSAGIRQVGSLSLVGEPAEDREVVPIFAHGRIFVLLGGELVEAAEEDGALREVRRVRLP